jgi:prepilin-type N-terminal cleavage/methylation domain-containing protein
VKPIPDTVTKQTGMNEKTQQGFTLIEVMISIAILSSLLVVIIQSNTETAFFLRKTKQLSIAQKVVINELLKIERENKSDLATSEGTFEEEHVLAGNKWKLTVSESTFLEVVPITKITYQVFWMFEGHEHSYESSITR